MEQLDPALPPAEVLRRLDDGARELIAANRALYQGSWDDMAEDIRRRQSGQPYLFRLKLAVNDALGWIHRLKAYEDARGERLADVLPAEEQR